MACLGIQRAIGGNKAVPGYGFEKNAYINLSSLLYFVKKSARFDMTPTRKRCCFRSSTNTAFRSLLWVAVMAWLAPWSFAERDSLHLGTGADGALTVSTSGLVVNAYAKVTAALAVGDTAVTVAATTGFASGQLVLVYQATGMTPVPASGVQTQVDLTSSSVGRFELARITSLSATTINLTAPLVNSYAANVTQLVRVPEYTTVTINAGRSMSAGLWDGSKGGVLAFLATGAITNNGVISADARGFRGGVSVDDLSGTTGSSGLDEPAAAGAQKGEGIAVTRYGATNTGRGNVANGAGGGVAAWAGGGGGKGGNSSQTDGNRPVGGLGGASVTYGLLDHALLGGGAGAGHSMNGTGAFGGTGGGLIFVRAASLTGTGIVRANGGAGGNSSGEAASGGGAGGMVLMRLTGSGSSSAQVLANGGLGGSASSLDVGPGGGGGGGRIYFQSSSATPSTMTTNGGNPGTQADSAALGGANYGATAGAAGTVTTSTTAFSTPAVPVTTAPANGATIGTVTPTYSGTAATGLKVHLLVDGTEIGVPVADGTGNFSFTQPSALAVGSHNITAYAEDTPQATFSVVSTASTFTVAAAPTVTAISPTSGSTAGGTSVTITGANFLAGATVNIGGTAATNVTVVDGTTITCTTPAGTAGAASVQVTTGGGTNATNSLFSYVSPVPVLVSTSPANNAVGVAPNTSIVLTFDKNIVFATGQIQLVDVTDGTDTRIFERTMTPFFSEYVEGSGFNSALEIYNPNPTPITLSGSLRVYQNGFTFIAQQITLSNTIPAKGVYVLVSNQASPALLAHANSTWTGLQGVNGNDAIEFLNGGVLVDSIGQVGNNPVGGGWGSGSTSTLDHTLRRKPSVTTGRKTSNTAFNPATEWDGFAIDTFGDLGAHTMNDPYVTNGTTLTLTPSSNLIIGHTYSVQYASGVITATDSTPASALTAGQANFTVGGSPTISNVTSTTADGSYTVGAATIPITVSFSSSVTVTGAPTLALNSGGTATYASGSPGTDLIFNYTVGATQNSADLDYTGTGALTLAGGTINAATGGAAATLTLPSPGAAGSLGFNKAIVIDTTAPTILSINRQTPSAQITGSATVTFLVTYSENVVGVTTNSFAVIPANGSNIVGTVTGVSGTGNTRDVTVHIDSGTGDFRLRGVN